MAAELDALVCSGDEAVRRAVADARLALLHAPTPKHQVERLRQGACHVVVLDPESDPELRTQLHALAGRRRRRLLVVLVGESFATGDRFQTWSESVDLLVNPADLGAFASLLEQTIREKREFYRAFEAVQQEGGVRLGAHA